MSPVFLASYVALWILVVLLSFLVLVLYRQLGEMYLGTKEGRTRDGVRLGSRAPEVSGLGQEGEAVRLPVPAPTLVAFVSPQCGPCRVLMPDLVQFARARPGLAVVAIGGPDDERTRTFAAEFRTPFSFLTQPNHWISAKYRVRSTPFAFYLDDAGVVRAKGIVNRLAQLEQLVERGEKLTPPRSVPHDAAQEVTP